MKGGEASPQRTPAPAPRHSAMRGWLGSAQKCPMPLRVHPLPQLWGERRGLQEPARGWKTHLVQLNAGDPGRKEPPRPLPPASQAARLSNPILTCSINTFLDAFVFDLISPLVFRKKIKVHKILEGTFPSMFRMRPANAESLLPRSSPGCASILPGPRALRAVVASQAPGLH